MEVAEKAVTQRELVPDDEDNKSTSPRGSQQQHQPQQKTKRKNRRGKPKSKNANKPYKKTNWKFQVPRYNYNNGGGNASMNTNRNGGRAKLMRSRSLVPYNTNKFLMEEHLPSAMMTPSGRTRDSSFSVDSEDNYFFSLPEDEEEFLTKEFANVYEKARVERLENFTKQELIDEILTIEDRNSEQGSQKQQQRISAEFLGKIRVLEEKIMDLSRENYNLRCQLMRSAALAAAAAASPPSAAAPTTAACVPTPMESSSDSESDSDSSSSSSSSNDDGHDNVIEDADDAGGGGGGNEQRNQNGYVVDDEDNECQQLLGGAEDADAESDLIEQEQKNETAEHM